MAAVEKFDFLEFVATVKGLARKEQQAKVRDEINRIGRLLVREPSWKFKQQLYMKRLARLKRFLEGEDVTQDLTPTEIDAYTLLLEAEAARPVAEAAKPAAASAAAAPARSPATSPGAAPAAAAPTGAITGAERRTSRRIQMKTRVRIRRDSDSSLEVLEPLNVSRGGIGFASSNSYTLHETVWVNLHHQAGQPVTDEMETRSIIVRAAPDAPTAKFSYGVKFLGP